MVRHASHGCIMPSTRLLRRNYFGGCIGLHSLHQQTCEWRGLVEVENIMAKRQMKVVFYTKALGGIRISVPKNMAKALKQRYKYFAKR